MSCRLQIHFFLLLLVVMSGCAGVDTRPAPSTSSRHYYQFPGHRSIMAHDMMHSHYRMPPPLYYSRDREREHARDYRNRKYRNEQRERREAERRQQESAPAPAPTPARPRMSPRIPVLR